MFNYPLINSNYFTDEIYSEEDISEFLEIVAAKEAENPKNYTFFFDGMDSNPLKRVIISPLNKKTITVYHTHDFYELNICIKGSLIENINGKKMTLHAGEAVMLSPGVYHTNGVLSDSICYHILFPEDFLAQSAQNFKKYSNDNYLSSIYEKKIYTLFSPSNDGDLISNLVTDMHKTTDHLHHRTDLFTNLRIENMAIEVLLSLTKYVRHEYDAKNKAHTKTINRSPEEMVRYITDNFDKISLEDAAAHFGYSRSRFHRIIKNNTGRSFTQIILDTRMMRARHLLFNTELNMRQIASLLGFESQEHFIRTFKKNRGITPKQYRKQFAAKPKITKVK